MGGCETFARAKRFAFRMHRVAPWLLCWGLIAFSSIEARADFGDSEFEPFYFVHVGDPQVDNVNAMLRFRQLIAAVNRIDPPPAFAIIAGDLINTPQSPSQTGLFESSLLRFDTEVILLPGNHDIHNMSDLEYYRSRYGDDYFRFTYNNCDFLVLNSEVLLNLNSYGLESEEQWRWLEETLDESGQAGRQHLLIASHHPPFFISQGEGSQWFDLTSPLNWPKPERGRLLAAARSAGCGTFICGHTHRTRVHGDSEFRIYTVAGTQVDFDGAAMGFRLFKVLPDRIEQFFIPMTTTDTVAPSPPTGLRAEALSINHYRLQWDASTDNVGVLWYEGWRDGERRTLTLERSFEDAPLLPGRTYRYDVVAIDWVGNMSGLSEELELVAPAPPTRLAPAWPLYR